MAWNLSAIIDTSRRKSKHMRSLSWVCRMQRFLIPPKLWSFMHFKRQSSQSISFAKRCVCVCATNELILNSGKWLTFLMFMWRTSCKKNFPLEQLFIHFSLFQSCKLWLLQPPTHVVAFFPGHTHKQFLFDSICSVYVYERTKV